MTRKRYCRQVSKSCSEWVLSTYVMSCDCDRWAGFTNLIHWDSHDTISVGLGINVLAPVHMCMHGSTTMGLIEISLEQTREWACMWVCLIQHLWAAIREQVRTGKRTCPSVIIRVNIGSRKLWWLNAKIVSKLRCTKERPWFTIVRAKCVHMCKHTMISGIGTAQGQTGVDRKSNELTFLAIIWHNSEFINSIT